MHENRILIGERIEYAIKLRGKTNVDVANAIGKDKSTVGRYIKGEVEKINVIILQAIADYLNVNPVWLMGKDVPMELESKRLSYNGSNTRLIEADEFTYALYEETKDLTENQKEIIKAALIGMASEFKKSKEKM